VGDAKHRFYGVALALTPALAGVGEAVAGAAGA